MNYVTWHAERFPASCEIVIRLHCDFQAVNVAFSLYAKLIFWYKNQTMEKFVIAIKWGLDIEAS